MSISKSNEYYKAEEDPISPRIFSTIQLVYILFTHLGFGGSNDNLLLHLLRYLMAILIDEVLIFIHYVLSVVVLFRCSDD